LGVAYFPRDAPPEGSPVLFAAVAVVAYKPVAAQAADVPAEVYKPDAVLAACVPAEAYKPDVVLAAGDPEGLCRWAAQELAGR
jgi:hypothetical protein